MMIIVKFTKDKSLPTEPKVKFIGVKKPILHQPEGTTQKGAKTIQSGKEIECLHNVGENLISDEVLKGLYEELRLIKVDRDDLSRSIAPKVRAYENRGLYQGKPVTIRDLEALEADISQYTDQASEVYKKIQHYERFKELPKEETSDNIEEIDDAFRLKEMRRSAINRRSKVKKKLELSAMGKKPRNPLKLLEWEQQLLTLDAEYDSIQNQITELSERS